MNNSRLSRLLALSEREYTKTRAAPTRQKFKALKVNLGRFDRDWDRQRGAAARMAAIVLTSDSESLLARMADEQLARSFVDAVDWLRQEASILRKTASRMDLAAARLGAVVHHHQQNDGSQQPAAGTAAAAG